jgi:hypothetical protein
VAEIVQGLAKILKLKWKVHVAYRPQSSGNVEHINRILKITLAKVFQETQSSWITSYHYLCSEQAVPLDPLADTPPIINRLTGDLRKLEI